MSFSNEIDNKNDTSKYDYDTNMIGQRLTTKPTVLKNSCYLSDRIMEVI